MVEFDDYVDGPGHSRLRIVAQRQRPAHHVGHGREVETRRYDAEDIEEISHAGRPGRECTMAAATRLGAQPHRVAPNAFRPHAG